MTTQLRYEDDENGLFTNKSTMMANFEEWIKMATDNKINSRNSWNFALIDYFHDLNVLKDAEDNINFQKASATLDGCVKIYSHRVDSVATETGKLLSGLAESKRNKRSAAEGSGEHDGDVEDEESLHDDSIHIDPLTGLPVAKDDPETLAKKKRTYNRVLETTLVDFESIRVKDLDQNLNIDPLFKKALADFDEGGAKSLLINTLDVDDKLRIVFDATPNDLEKEKRTVKTTNSSAEAFGGDRSSFKDNEILSEDTTNEISGRNDEKHVSAPEASILESKNTSVIIEEDDILDLGMKFVDFEIIEASSICPSMDQLLNAVADIEKAKLFVENVTERSDKFLSEEELKALKDIDDVEEDYAGNLGQGIDNGLFEENGPIEDNIEDYGANVEHSLNQHTTNDSFQFNEDEKSGMASTFMDEELLAYFDSAMAKNWRGREHWKVRSIKAKLNDGLQSKTIAEDNNIQQNQEITGKKLPKSHFEINFFDLEDDDEEKLFSSKKGPSIELPLKQRTSDSHYLLPNDYKFSTDKITRLFIKPQQTMSFFSNRRRAKEQPTALVQFENTEYKETTDNPQVADEHFWADNYQLHEQERLLPPQEDNPTNGSQGNSFEDDNGIDFNQAFEDEDLDVDMKDDFYNTQGLLQNNKVAYSKTSKKVDVRKLKNNVWKSIQNQLHVLVEEEQENHDKFEEPSTQPQNEDTQPTTIGKRENYELKFTDVAKEIISMYSSTSRKDLSTSFCFICLLHLANEHGFTINDANNYHDLNIEIPEAITRSILGEK